MAGNAEIAVVLKLVADQFSREMKKQEGVVGQFLGSMNRQKVVVGAVTAAMFALAKSAADYGDHLFKSAQKLGMTVQALAALEYAAKLADVSQEQLGTGMVKLAKNSAEAATGAGESMAAFAALGVSVTDSADKLKSTDVLFGDLAERFSQIEDGSGKTALAVKIFGKSGAELIPLLNAGKDGLKEAADEAKRFGLILTDDQARASEKFNDDLTRLQSATRGLSVAVGNELVPSLEGLVNVFTSLSSGPVGGLMLDFLKRTLAGFAVVGIGADSIAQKIKAMWEGGDVAAKFAKIQADVTAQLTKLEIDSSTGQADTNFLTDSTKKRIGQKGTKKEDAPSIQTGEEAKSIEKLSKALLDAAKAKEKLAQATVDHSHAVREEQRLVEDSVVALQRISGVGDEEIARHELEIKQRRLAEDKAFQESKLKIIEDSTRKQIEIVRGGAQEQAAHLIAAGKTTEAKAAIEASKQQAAQIRVESLEKRESIKADIDKIEVQRSLIQSESALGAVRRQELRGVAQAQADLARVEQQASLDTQALDLARREGKINEIEQLRMQIGLERELRQARIAAAQAAVGRTVPGSAEHITAQSSLDNLTTENAARSAQEQRQIVQSTKEFRVHKAQEAASLELQIADLQLADEQEMGDKKKALIGAEMDARLLTVQAGSEEETRIRRLAAEQWKQADEEANGDFFSGWQRGLRGYVKDTDGAFGMSRDMARQTAQAMQSGFQTFFFDFMQGRVMGLKDAFKGLLNFSQQILSQVASQMATKAVIGAFTSGAGAAAGGGGGGLGSLFGSLGFNQGGVVPAVQYFAAGGVPSFTNGDSVRAMLTPGEGVLSRGGMEALGKLNNGQTPGGGGGMGNVRVEVHNAIDQGPARATADFDNTKREWVVSVIFDEIRQNGSLREAMRGA